MSSHRINVKTTLIIFCLLIGGSLPAQNFGEITGIVKSNETGDVLVGAQVQIKDTFLGDVCNEKGRFRLSNLETDIYWLKITYIGHASKELRVDLRNKQNINLSIELDPTLIQMDQVIVTGSRQPEDLSAAVASVSVLGAREIQSRNNFRLDEALLSIPGVNLVGENINIRGGSGYNRLGGSRVLVLLDDVPILTSDLSSANWNIVPVTAVDHIEILKGAASSLYGSGAISGVVNIITKNPNSHRSLKFRQSTGVYDNPSVPEWNWTDKRLYYNRTDVGYSDSFGPVGFRFDIAYQNSTGDRELGNFDRLYLTGKTNLRFPDQSNLTFFLTYSYDDRDLFLRWIRQNNALNVPSSDRNNRIKLKGFVGYAVYQKLFSPTLSTKLRFSYNRQLVGIPFNLSSTFRPALGFSGELQANWLLHPEHSISMGIDYKYDEVESKYYGKRSANGISPYLQEIWKISRLLQLNLGLRYDTYTLVGDSVETQLSPRIGLSYQPFEGTIFHSSFGRGFRAASVVERFLAVDEGGDVKIISNPQLQPERSVLFDFGIRQSIGNCCFAEVAVFSSEFRNLIEISLDPKNLNVQYISYPKAKIDGIEASINWNIIPDFFSINANATWMNPRFVDSDTLDNGQIFSKGEPLPYRPRFIGFFTPKFQFGPIEVEADYRYSSRLQRVLVYPRDEQIPTKVWDLRVSYHWRNFQFKFLVNNIVNYNYLISERVLGEIRNFAIAINGEI